MKLHRICLIFFLSFLLSGCAVMGLLSDLADDSGEPSPSESAGGDKSESQSQSQSPSPSPTPRLSKPARSEPAGQAAAQSGSEQAQAPAPEKTPEPEEPLYAGVLRVSNEEAISDVRVLHVADDGFNRPELAEYEVVDLGDFASYHEFVDSYDTASRVIFMADAPVKDFRYLEIETVFDEDMGVVIVEPLCRLDELTPEKPFVVNWMSIGDIGMFRGVSFTDEGGATRYFGFNISGFDGDVYLIEFKPE